MSNQTVSKTFIPQADGRGLDFIKICAAVFMVIDHVNSTLLGGTRLEMLMLGRITFPLFCYALAVALFKAGEEKAFGYALKRYTPRLLIFAVLTEPIARFSRDIGDTYNVMFTLALGAAVAGLSLRMKDRVFALLCIVSVGLMYFPPLTEFSFVGIMLPAGFLFAMRKRPLGVPCLLLLLACVNYGNYGALIDDFAPQALVLMVMMSLFCIIPPLWLIRFAATMPQSGRYLPKYFLHVFYPAHMLAIWAVGRYIMHLPQ